MEKEDQSQNGMSSGSDQDQHPGIINYSFHLSLQISFDQLVLWLTYLLSPLALKAKNEGLTIFM